MLLCCRAGRDPRFDQLTGTFDQDKFKSGYAFIFDEQLPQEQQVRAHPEPGHASKSTYLQSQPAPFHSANMPSTLLENGRSSWQRQLSGWQTFSTFTNQHALSSSSSLAFAGCSP